MKTIAVLGIAGLSIPKKIERARFMVTSMTANAFFTTPNPTLASVTTAINNLETAHITALGGGVDDTANMRTKETALDIVLKSLCSYVETIANATPASAEAIILSAGMSVKGKGGKVVHEFEVKVTDNPGEVKLVHQGIARGTFEFQMTTDPNTETSWQKIYRGTRASLLKSGLISGTRYYFRSMVVDKDGESPWSGVLNTIVL